MFGFSKVGEFLDQLQDYMILKELIYFHCRTMMSFCITFSKLHVPLYEGPQTLILIFRKLTACIQATSLKYTVLLRSIVRHMDGPLFGEDNNRYQPALSN